MDAHTPSKQPNQGQLTPVFGLQMAIVLVVSSMIGSGVYKKVAVMSADLQSPVWVLVAWALAGIVSLLGVFTIAEIAGKIPGSGGPFAYLYRMYGRPYGFAYGWASFTAIQSASIASISYVFAHSLNAVAPLPRLAVEIEQWNLWGIFYPLENIGVKMAAIALILVLTYINYRGVRLGGGLSWAITAAVVVSLLIIIGLGLGSSHGSMANIVTPAKNYQATNGWGLVTLLFKGMLGAFWAYDGWIALGYMGGEIKDGQRNLPKALIWGTLIVIVLYSLVNFTYLYVLPIDQMIAIAADTNKIAAVEVIRVIFGNSGVLLLSVLIVVTTAGCTNTNLMAAARIYQTMAGQRLFYPKTAYVHPRYHTPSNALIYQAVISCLLVFSGTFDQLTDMLVFAQFIFYGAVAVGLFVLRRREPETSQSYKVWGYPVVPALFALFCAYLVGNTLYTNPRDAGFSLALIALGIPFYWKWTRKR